LVAYVAYVAGSAFERLIGFASIMGKYLDIIRRTESERGGRDKSVLSDQSTALRSHKSLMSQAAASEPTAAVCAVCKAPGDLWTAGTVLVHQQCAEFLPRPESAEPTAAYRATSTEPDGTGCEVEIVELPTATRYKKVFAVLQLRPPALVPIPRWRQCVEDGRRFLAKWGEQAEALGWSSADLFALHQPPAKPHPSYSRLSRYDATGLCWLLEGREMVALTADTATIKNPVSGAITVYRKHNKPALGPLGDTLEDFVP
jgi:hypothetical protein